MTSLECWQRGGSLRQQQRLMIRVRFYWMNGDSGEGFAIRCCGCCNLVVWVRFCWMNDDLGEDLGLGVVGYDL